MHLYYVIVLSSFFWKARLELLGFSFFSHFPSFFMSYLKHATCEPEAWLRNLLPKAFLRCCERGPVTYVYNVFRKKRVVLYRRYGRSVGMWKFVFAKKLTDFWNETITNLTTVLRLLHLTMSFSSLLNFSPICGEKFILEPTFIFV